MDLKIQVEHKWSLKYRKANLNLVKVIRNGSGNKTLSSEYYRTAEVVQPRNTHFKDRCTHIVSIIPIVPLAQSCISRIKDVPNSIANELRVIISKLDNSALINDDREDNNTHIDYYAKTGTIVNKNRTRYTIQCFHR